MDISWNVWTMDSSNAPNATVPSEVVQALVKAAFEGFAEIASTGSCRWKYHWAVTPAKENLSEKDMRYNFD